MKKCRKALAFFLVFCMTFTTAGFSSLIAAAAEGLEKATEAVSGDFEYTVLDDGTAEITDYTGSATELVIPSEIDGYKVARIGMEAFDYCTSLKVITIPVGVTSIGGHAFYYCESLTDIAIPDSVTSIGDWAFSGCDSLTNIMIPDGVTSIGWCVFDGCTSLKDIIIPNGVTDIRYSAFGGCASLTDITIPDSVTIIDGSAFYGCTSLTDITIPNNVVSIGDDTFLGCESLRNIIVDVGNVAYSDIEGVLFNKEGTEIIRYPEGKMGRNYIIPDGVTSIGNYAFSGCDSLTNILIPDGITSIGYSAFNGCSSLTDIMIPYGVTNIEPSTFDSCTSLADITIPNSVTSIGGEAFSGCVSLTNIIIPDGVTSIEDYAFSGCGSLTNIMIPDGVTSIEWGAFSGCVSLTNIAIPDSVTIIEGSAFHSCKFLADITIPDSVTGIGREAFAFCESLTDITISDSVTSIGSYAFNGCTSLADITIPDGVTSIENDTFLNCESLTNITIPDSVTNIGSHAFSNCRSLTNIIIPDGVTSIGESAFSGCENLTDFIIPDSVTSIGNSVFYCCESLADITIPDSVTSIGGSAFFSCESLTDITIPNSVRSIGSSAFSYCTSLTDITIPDSVTSIGSSAFSYCESLTDITIPDGVTSIGHSTFDDCTSLTDIIIPDSITSIGDWAFYNCVSLTDVYYTGSEEQWKEISISSWNSPLLNANIYYNWEIHEHEYAVKRTTEPTCTQPGEIVYTCWCGKEKIESIPPMGHSYAQTIVEPTCTENGYILYKCTVCGDSYIEETSQALGHTPGAWVTLQEPTCVTDGRRVKYCEVCNEIVADEKIQAAGHNYVERVIESTCTQQGYTLHECTVCGASYKDSFVEAKGHVAGEWVIEREPTCTVDGIRVQRCTVCGEALACETIPSGHKYTSAVVAPTCTEKGYTEHICQVCGFSYRDNYIDALGHRPGEWVTTKEPACTTDGERAKYCTVCNELLVKEPIPAIGHNYSDTVVQPTCTEKGYTQHDCANCGDSYRDSFTDALGHTEGEWIVQKDPTCTSTGTRQKYCTVCSELIRSEVLPALGHLYSEMITLPDCTHGGYTLFVCDRCGHQYKGNYTDPTGHSFGEWIVDKQATVLEKGAEHRICAVCGFTEQVVIPKKEIDISQNQDYGLCNFTVVNAQTREPVKNASILISTENDGECTLQTDEMGKVSQILPVGAQSISVYADGCLTRNLNIQVKPGEQNIPAIGLSDKPTYEVELDSHLMTIEEIEEAGIDTSAPENQHVYRYELTLEFEAQIDWYSLFYYMNGNGEIIGGGGSRGGGSGEIVWVPAESGNRGGHFFIPDSEGQPVSIYPVSERFYLIVRGEVKWLKEMFDVEMLIVNNSMTDTLEDLTATLTLPEGLSLAQMSGEQQSLTQHIEHIAEGQSATVHWYVRGDKAGSYGISARLQGTVMPFEEEIDEVYEGKNQIQVWAGNALHLHFEFPNAAYYGEDYPITITLTNVSDITLYNVTSKIQIVQGMEYHYYNGISEEKIETADLYSKGVKEFKPGDQIIIEASTNIFFESEMMEAKLQSLIGLVDGMEQLYNGFKAVKDAIDIVGSLIDCVTGCVSAIDDFLSNSSILPNEKLTLFTKLYESVSDLMTSYGTSGSGALDSMIRLSNTGLDDVLSLITSDPETWYKNASAEDIVKITKEINSLASQASGNTVSEKFDIFDSLRTAISAIPISFVLANVVLTEDAGNTTSIPWSYSVSQAGPQYFGVSNVSGYVSSLVRTAMDQIYSDFMPGCVQIIPGLDDPFNYDEAVRTIQATEKEIALFKAKDATGEVKYKAWIVENNEQSAYGRTAKTSNFVLDCDNDTAVVENGVLTFTGDGMIAVTPISQTGGTLYIEDSYGNLYVYEIEVVPEHICAAGEREVVFNPTAEYDGFAVRRCETCGEILEIENLSHQSVCKTHTFGDWTVEKQATCSEQGIRTRICTICGYAESEFIATTENHVVSNWTIITEPTCTSEGLKKGFCDLCGEEITENIAKLEHEANAVWEIVKEPTETEEGVKVLKCKYCGEVLKEEVIPATGGGTDPEEPEEAALTLTIDGQAVEGDVAYVKLPSVLMMYKKHSATLGFTFDREVEVKSVKWSYANWSVSSPEANIESPDSSETVIRPNGKGIGARSTWVTLTVTDVDGKVHQETVKVRFYKWDWQRK